jgi:hypothetical protein
MKSQYKCLLPPKLSQCMKLNYTFIFFYDIHTYIPTDMICNPNIPYALCTVCIHCMYAYSIQFLINFFFFLVGYVFVSVIFGKLWLGVLDTVGVWFGVCTYLPVVYLFMSYIHFMIFICNIIIIRKYTYTYIT